jgi:hypothetical protein
VTETLIQSLNRSQQVKVPVGSTRSQPSTNDSAVARQKCCPKRPRILQIHKAYFFVDFQESLKAILINRLIFNFSKSSRDHHNTMADKKKDKVKAAPDGEGAIPLHRQNVPVHTFI